MEVILGVSELGSQKVKCPTCARPMRLVGIEPHPKIPGMVDLVTYECACGEVKAHPRLSAMASDALPAAH
jgi:hypothetical protein